MNVVTQFQMRKDITSACDLFSYSTILQEGKEYRYNLKDFQLYLRKLKNQMEIMNHMSIASLHAFMQDTNSTKH